MKKKMLNVPITYLFLLPMKNAHARLAPYVSKQWRVENNLNLNNLNFLTIYIMDFANQLGVGNHSEIYDEWRKMNVKDLNITHLGRKCKHSSITVTRW